MADPAAVLAVGGMVGLVGGIVTLAWYLDKKRTEAVQAWAQANAFQFEGDAQGLINELGVFKLFNQGRARKARNLCRGAKEVGAVRVCDYQYTTGSGKHQHTHSQTIVVVNTPGRSAPHFFIRKQNRFFDALGKLFGGQDINFDDDETFSKGWVLQTGGDEQQLRQFFTPRLRDAFNRMADKNVVMEVNGDVMVMHFGRRLKVDDIAGLVSDAVNLRRNWS